MLSRAEVAVAVGGTGVTVAVGGIGVGVTVGGTGVGVAVGGSGVAVTAGDVGVGGTIGGAGVAGGSVCAGPHPARINTTKIKPNACSNSSRFLTFLLLMWRRNSQPSAGVDFRPAVVVCLKDCTVKRWTSAIKLCSDLFCYDTTG